MRFAPTEDQTEFAAAVRGLLSDTCTPSDVAASWGGATGRHTGLGDGNGRVSAAWSALVDMGVLALGVPESNGGLGMGFDDLVGILIECGRAGLPDPVADTVAVATQVLAGDSGPLVPGWLERIAGGATVVTGFGPLPLVPSASSADAVLLFSSDPAGIGPTGSAAGVADAQVRFLEMGDVQLDPAESVDGARALSRVTHDPEAGTLLASGQDAIALAETAFNRAALADSAIILGLCRTMLDLTVEYVSERKQFGVPVGSFQAIKHHVADAGSAVEFVGPLVAHGAHLLGGGTSAMATSGGRPVDASVAVSMAKARASTAAQVVSETALQCHGAIGYTVEADLQLFMKRAWALSRSHGDADFHRSRVREHLVASA